MNRTDRLLAVLLELQARRHTRAEDLACRFETSKRTIYRDIQALSESGVPVVAEAGVGYSLAAGYFLPPLSFTPDEAAMLILGADFMEQSLDGQYREAAGAARTKIQAVLSERTSRQVAQFRERICFAPGDPAVGQRRAEFLPLLRRAVLECRRIRFTYRTRHTTDGGPSTNIREADPYALGHWAGLWYMSGYCHLRRDIRNFRADRMSDLTLLDRTFERPTGVRLPTEDDVSTRPKEARILFDSEVAGWVRETMTYYATAVDDTAEGLLVTVRYRTESEILHWIRSWGASARVLHPEALRRQIADEARKILERC